MKATNRTTAHRRKQGRRRAKFLAAAVASIPLVAFPAVGMASAADAPVFDALPDGPARVLTLSLIPGGNDDDMRGVMCQGERTCVSVPYPYLIRSVGVVDLDNALHEGAPGRQVIFGYSQGARVATDWLLERAGTVGAPTPDELSFVLIGNPGRKYGGAHVDLGQVTPETDYHILDVSRQYDMASDVPDHFNLLAIANALAGFSFVHPNYEDVDLYAPTNYVWKEGNTTYVFVPTENLPLLEPLRWIGLSGLADSLNAPLKAIIEQAYDRSYLPAQPGLPPVEPEPEEPTTEPEPEEPAPAALTVSRNATTTEEDTTAVVPESVDPQAEPEPDSEAGDEVEEEDTTSTDSDDDEPANDIEADAETEAEPEAEAAEDEDAAPAASEDTDSPSESNESSESNSSSDSDE